VRKILAGMNIRRCGAAAFVASALALGMASALANSNSGTLTITGTDAGSPINGGTGIIQGSSSIGNLMTPSNITFTDVLNATGASAVTTVDDWSFTVPAAVFGATVTGDELSLSSFTFSGNLVDTFTLFKGSPGSGTVIDSGSGGLPGQFVLGTITSAGNYYLEVTATLAANSTGSYTGTLVAAALSAPEPASLGLMGAGMCAVFATMLLRRRARR